MRISSKKIDIEYIRGITPPNHKSMLYNYGQRISNGTQHHVKAKLVKEGMVKITSDRIIALHNFSNLFKINNDDDDDDDAKDDEKSI